MFGPGLFRRLGRSVAWAVLQSDERLRRLENSAVAQACARRLHIRQIVNEALRRYPIRRTMPVSGVRYILRTWESFEVERMYLRDGPYMALFQDEAPRGFIDLGCNSGLFQCLMSHVNGGEEPFGLCVDANETQTRLAQENVAINGWDAVHVLWGLAGSLDPDADSAEFFLHPTSLGSSQYRDAEASKWIGAGDWKPVRVPVIHVADTWDARFGPTTRCGCLKIDIEGSEMVFMRQEARFLDRVDAILMEWHAWGTTRDEVVAFLSSRGFGLARVIEDGPNHGVVFFRRAGRASPA